MKRPSGPQLAHTLTAFAPCILTIIKTRPIEPKNSFLCWIVERAGHFCNHNSSTGMAGAIRMIGCDTIILIEFYQKTPNIVQELHVISYKHAAISAITQAELYFGALDKAELRKIKTHLSLLMLLPGQGVAQAWGDARAAASSGHKNPQSPHAQLCRSCCVATD